MITILMKYHNKWKIGLLNKLINKDMSKLMSKEFIK